MNGCEVAKEILAGCGLDRWDSEDIMYLDKSSEYWIGWALAYYQWRSGYEYSRIFKTVSTDELYGMYLTLHEADVELFVEIMNQKMSAAKSTSTLKRLRTYAGLSQSQLAKKSEVPLRQIQLFEQKQRDINKTQGETLVKLARALNCKIEDIL